MAGLDPAIYMLLAALSICLDGRIKRGHDRTMRVIRDAFPSARKTQISTILAETA